MSETYSSNDHPEHHALITTAVDAMYGALLQAGSSGVPLTLLLNIGVDATGDTTSPRDYAFEWPHEKNLYLAAGLPIWGLALWGHLLDKCRDELDVQSGQGALLCHMTDGAPLLTFPIAKSMRSYASPRWLPLLVVWTGAK